MLDIWNLIPDHPRLQQRLLSEYALNNGVGKQPQDELLDLGKPETGHLAMHRGFLRGNDGKASRHFWHECGAAGRGSRMGNRGCGSSEVKKTLSSQI